MRLIRSVNLLLTALIFSACDGSGNEDAGTSPDRGVVVDLGTRDTGPTDTGTGDLGVADSGSTDSGDLDLGAPDQGGTDASEPDAEATDAEPSDTGVDLCTPNPCFAGVTCTNEPGGFSCGDCPSGLIGDGLSCEENDECASAPCLPGSTCTDVLAPGTGFSCSPCVGPSCPILRAQAGPDQPIVLGTVATLMGSATGYNGAFTCEWTNNQDAAVFSTCTATASPAVDTVYTLTVTDASGATASDSMVIRIVGLIADAGQDRNILSTETATLTAAWTGASCNDASCIECEWRLSNGTLVSSSCTALVSPGATTQYFLTVTDTGNNQTATDSATVFVTDLPAQLCGWDVVVMRSNEYPSAPNPNYICDANGTARRQTVNGKPAIVLSDLVVSNTRITGYISVETAADDDPIGFIWGWENPKHHYLLTWKKVAQNWTAACGNAPRGIAVKKIDGAEADPTTISFEAAFGYNATDYVYSCADGWSLDRANDPLLADDTIFLIAPADPGAYTLGWVSNITYRFEFYYTPTKTKIFVYEDDLQTGSTANLVTTLLVEDSSYPAGAFAFYSNSQQEVHFGNFSLAALSDYSVDAGPDRAITAGDTVSFTPAVSLAVPPYACSWTDSLGTEVSTTCDADLSPTTSDTYLLTVTDDFARITTDSVTVTVN